MLILSSLAASVESIVMLSGRLIVLVKWYSLERRGKTFKLF